jgi:hypothetical protein
MSYPVSIQKIDNDVDDLILGGNISNESWWEGRSPETEPPRDTRRQFGNDGGRDRNLRARYDTVRQ